MIFDASCSASSGFDEGATAQGLAREYSAVVFPIDESARRKSDANGLRSAGRGRNYVQCRGARPIQILVQLIERRLVVGIGMHRGHESLVDADRVVEHLDDGREAIGGARRIGNDDMRLRELVVIDAVDDGQVDPVGRR